jgi:hypothetical protein
MLIDYLYSHLTSQCDATQVTISNPARLQGFPTPRGCTVASTLRCETRNNAGNILIGVCACYIAYSLLRLNTNGPVNSLLLA